MATFTVADLTASLSLNKGTFDQDLQKSGQSVEQLGEKAKRTGSSLGSALTGGLRAASVVTGGLLVATGALATSVVKTGVSYNILQQNSRAALKTLLGGAQAANAQMDKLDAFAKNSPFAKDIFIKGQQQLLAFGMEAKKVIPVMDAVQQAVAASGGSSQTLNDVVTILAKMQSTGKVTAEDLNQLGGHGIDAATLMGEAFGKTGKEMREDISDGAVGADEAIEALTQSMQKKFGGATDAIKQQMSGAADRVKGATRDIGALLARPFVDPQGGGRAVDWVNQFADLLRSLEKQLGPLSNEMIRRLSPAFDAITTGLGRAKELVDSFSLRDFNSGLDTLIDYAPGVAALSVAFLSLSGGIPIVSGALAALGVTINPVAAGLAAAAAVSPEFRGAIGDILGAAEPLVPVLARLVSSVAVGLTEAFQAATPLVEGFVPAIESIVDIATPVLDFLSGMIVGLGTLSPELLTAAAAVGVAVVAIGKIKALNNPFSGLVNRAKGFREEMDLQRALAGGYTGGFQLLGDGADKTSRKFSEMGTAAHLAGRHIKGGLANAASGLMGLLGGPWGIALIAASAGIGYFMQKQAEAKAHVEDLTKTLDEQTGAITKNTISSIGEKLADDSVHFLAWLGGAKEIGEVARMMGTDLTNLAGIIAGDETTYQNYVDLLRQYPGAYQGSTMSMEEWADAMGISVPQAEALAGTIYHTVGVLEAERDALGKSKVAHEELTGAQEAAAERTQSFNDALRTMNDEASTADQRVRALRDALDILNGKIPTTDEAVKGFNDEMRSANDAMKDAEGNWRNFGNVIDKSTGQINTAGQAGSDLYDILDGMTGKTLAVADAQAQAGDSAKSIKKGLQEAQDEWVKMADKAGIGADEAIAAWERMMGGNPKEIATLLKLEGKEGAEGELADYSEKLQEIDGKKAIAEIEGRDDDLKGKLGGAIGSLEDFNKTVATATADLDPKKADAVRRRILLDLADLANENPTVMADMDPKLLEEAYRIVLAKLEHLGKQKPTPKVIAETAAAQAQLDAINSTLDTINGKNTYATHTQTTVYATEYKGPMARTVAPASPVRWPSVGPAAGAIIQGFAEGGFHRPLTPMDPIAQMVPSNTWRVVGDNLKVPEMYVPMDGSARSLSILDQGLAMMGFDRVPKNSVRGYATGALVGSSEATTGTLAGSGASVLLGDPARVGGDTYEIHLHGVRMDYAEETAGVLLDAIKNAKRGGRYSEVK